ncbi:MAG: 50S ribosomal protein L20 [Candidatus Levybacteria bacterium RIFCSPHIGHO2_02_FULL_39_36]|nr:MAG: 50S ribosomal protein L20 [Candidatus Levybacteria bacterium GW2011_GWA1_39_11]KKR25336.1 MAG: 50S ribosomal protein L20 [Candidatus Levybacteria bacterium GW2011_GWB1_39_7]KKR50417.1 MAG: 50S ribosomal protein L20 [Candidatus Levybacteria bacterium GW2011_GWA2_40_16]OGH15436.1 MAG: 50S ribosomal protein L20 [Candidatus Levybacteria bacterium RIFCSPHIGHO2_01_FULL_38_96]OGH25502.1 MAG: 50S ribosomal protein L20 [Candidatus Levybacteria bacterium RIFCSPHIGHO2_12_FULL_39_39]OGH28883.1 MAG
MTRVKRGVVSHKKHNKLLSLTRGYRGTRSRLVKVAREAALHAGEYAFHGRKRKKRDFRRLWITRISEAVRQEGISYSKLIASLIKKNIRLDRKILSDLVLNDPQTFKKIVEEAKN